MSRESNAALRVAPVYTLAELATAMGYTRKNGHPDSGKAERRMRQLGVPVRPGRPRLVFLADLHQHAPTLFRGLRLGGALPVEGGESDLQNEG